MSDNRLTKFLSVFSKSIQEEIFGFCKRISSAKADVYIFLARKAAVFCDCLEELGQIHLDGYVTTDRSLDIDGEWLHGKNVVIIDDAVVSGTTLYTIIQRLQQFGVKNISIQILTINKRWYNSELLKNEEGESFVYPVYNVLPDNLCIKLCNDIVQAISLVPRPYDIDYPLYRSITIPEYHLNRILVLNNWYAQDIRTERQKDNNIINVSLLPNKQELQELSKALNIDLSHNCIAKIRVYGRLIDKAKRAFSLRISPMIIFNEMDIETVRSIFNNIVANSNNPAIFATWSSTSQLRFLQFYYSNHLAMMWYDNIHSIVPISEKLDYSYRNLSFLFPEEFIVPIENLCKTLFMMSPELCIQNRSLRRDREREPKSVYRSIDPISINARLYEPFLEMYHEKELLCRELVLKEGKNVFHISEYEPITNRLNEGLSFQDMTERLRDCVNDYNVEQKVSEFIDRSIDAGIIVPIIQQEGRFIFRAYRHGEDVLFGGREELMYRKMLSLFAEHSGSSNGLTRIQIEKLIVLFTKIGIKEEILIPYTSNFSSEPIDKNGRPMKILRVKPYLKGPISLLGNARQHQRHKSIPYVTNERKALWFTNVLSQDGFLKPSRSGKKYELGIVDKEMDEDFALLTEKERTFVQNFSELTGRISNPNCSVTDKPFNDTDWARIAVTLTLPDTVTAVAAEMEIFYNDFDSISFSPLSNDESKDYLDIKHFVSTHAYESIHSAIMKIESYTELRGQDLINSVHFPSNLEQRTWLGYFSDELDNHSAENNEFLQCLFYEQKVWAYLLQGIVNAIYLVLIARFKKYYSIEKKDEKKAVDARIRMESSFANLEKLRQTIPRNARNANLLFYEYDRMTSYIVQLSTDHYSNSSDILANLIDAISKTDDTVENIKEMVCDILGERGKVYDILNYNYAVHINIGVLTGTQKMKAQELINRAYRKEVETIEEDRRYAVSKGQSTPNKNIKELPQKFKPIPKDDNASSGIWYIACGQNIAKQVATFAMNVTVLLHKENIDCRITVFDRLSYEYCIRSNSSQNAEYHCNQFNTLMEQFKEKVLFPTKPASSSSIIHVSANTSKKVSNIAKEIQEARIQGTTTFQQNGSFIISGPSVSKTKYVITEYNCKVDRSTSMKNEMIIGINKNLFIWAESSKLYHEAVGSAETDSDNLSKALGPNETMSYQGSFALMKAIWNNHPKLGLAPDYEQLAEKEYSRSYYYRYRDHLTHMFKVFLLGLYLYENHSAIHNAIQCHSMTDEDFLSIWIITALYHDAGYLIETEDGCWDSNAGKDVLAKFNRSLSVPMAHLFQGKISPQTERVLQEKNNYLPPYAAGQSSIEGKLDSFAGFTKSVRLSRDEDGNPIKMYYEFACRKRDGRVYYDHGIVSACMLLFMRDSLEKYMNDSKRLAFRMYSDQQLMRDDYINALPKTAEYTKIAARAIAIHNIKKQWNEEEENELNRRGVTIGEFVLPLSEEPIAYLLRLCDELQCWDRQCFISPLGMDAPLDASKMSITNIKGSVSISIIDAKAKTSIERALKSLLAPELNQCINLTLNP